MQTKTQCWSKRAQKCAHRKTFQPWSHKRGATIQEEDEVGCEGGGFIKFKWGFQGFRQHIQVSTKSIGEGAWKNERKEGS
jgi:hypothetical protein